MASTKDHLQGGRNDAAGAKQSLIRRIVSYSAMILFVWLGLCLGALCVFLPGLMFASGTWQLSAVWEQAGGKDLFIGIFSVLTGGVAGSILGALCWRALIRRLGWNKPETGEIENEK